jgi:hypothetical protein
MVAAVRKAKPPAILRASKSHMPCIRQDNLSVLRGVLRTSLHQIGLRLGLLWIEIARPPRNER